MVKDEVTLKTEKGSKLFKECAIQGLLILMGLFKTIFP
jgi:hypothetical protein